MVLWNWDNFVYFPLVCYGACLNIGEVYTLSITGLIPSIPGVLVGLTADRDLKIDGDVA